MADLSLLTVVRPSRGSKMGLGIGISIIAVLVAALSALYTKRASDEARKANKVSREANEISRNQALRADRLALYNLMRDFALYCSRYTTHLSLGNHDGSRDLMIELDRFKDAAERLGPLEIDESEDFLRRMQGNAGEMQRLIDRIQVGQLDSRMPEYEDAKDHLSHISEWFAEQRKDLEKMFEPYLVLPHNK